MLIGITGTLGAGKGTIAQYLAKKHEFMYVSVRAFFAAEVVQEGKAVTRASVAEAAERIRHAHGATYPLEQLLNNTPRLKNVVIESIRTINEAQYLKTRGDALWAVDADVRTRFERIKAQSAEFAALSFEEFNSADQKELHSENPDLPSVLQLKDTMASEVFINNGTKDELFAQVDRALLKAKQGQT